MRVSDKMDVVRLMIETAEKSQVRVGDKMLIDSAKYIKRLGVELSLLEKEEEEELVNDALDEASFFGSEYEKERV